MSFTLNFYKLDKRINSTKQPTGNGTAVANVDLKGPCSVYNPVFVLDGIADDFNYVKWGSRYYFVQDCIRSARNTDFVEYHCILDELATLKSNILATSAFVAYSSSATPNSYCLDPRIPSDKSVHFEGGASGVSFTGFIDLSGSYIVGCVGEQGIKYYALTAAQLNTLGTKITAATASDIDNAFINKFGNLVDCITSVYWIPIAASSVPGTTESLYLGSYDTQISAKIAPALGWMLLPDSTVSLSYNYDGIARRIANERIALFLPGYGVVDLDPAAIGYETAIHVEATIDVQGNLCYRLHVIHNSATIYSSIFPCSIGVEVPFGKSLSTPQAAGAEYVSSLAEDVRTFTDNFASNHPKISSILNTIGETLGGNTGEAGVKFVSEIARLGSNAVTVGGFSGAAGARMFVSHPDIMIAVSSFGYCETQANMNAIYGRPVNRVMQLQNLTGYVQTVGASVSGAYPDHVLNSVSAQLNSGIYIE